jgi:hypothetical protein
LGDLLVINQHVRDTVRDFELSFTLLTLKAVADNFQGRSVDRADEELKQIRIDKALLGCRVVGHS